MRIHARFLSAAVAATVAASLPAQWPSSPSTNLSVADGTGEQVLPKIAALRDGGSYVG